jgi:transcriptional regulator of heat shock response
MDSRKLKILQAIIEKFVETAEPIGSKLIYEEYDLDVSPATIRNEMAILEDEGYIIQPHTSAGRVPTSLAYRLFVDQMKFNLMLFNKAKKDMETLRQQYDLKRVKEKLYETVAILAHVTQNVSFAMVPDNPRLFYMGLSNVLRKPEFASDPGRATQVVEVLENRFSDLLKSIEIRDDHPSFYIGDENVIPEIKSCSLLVQRYRYKGFHGIMGILGATRMDYPYNLAALKSAIELLE